MTEVAELTLRGGSVYKDGKLFARYSCPECGSIGVEKQNDVWFCMSGCGHASRKEFVCVTEDEQRAIDVREGRRSA